MLKVEVLDEEGRLVPTAKDMVNFTVTGPGALIGVGNGDPNCQESDKAPRRLVFNGLAQVIIQSTGTPGAVRIQAAMNDGAAQKTPAEYVITTTAVPLRRAVP